MLSLEGTKIIIAGGDKREIQLFFALRQFGANVKLSGFDLYKTSDPQINSELIKEMDMCNEFAKGQVFIFPLAGVNDKGMVFTPYSSSNLLLNDNLISSLPIGSLLLSGEIASQIREKLEDKVRLVETTNLDEIAILNAIPTAEGSIQYAMENIDITIHDSESFVLGFGHCGSALVRTLQGLGARVTVVARRLGTRIAVEAIGCRAFSFTEMERHIHRAEIIFNTVPAEVLNAQVLRKVKRGCLILDIASFPGGTDFTVAKELGLKANLLPSIPGKVAPKTAGKILGRIYPSLIINHLELKEGEDSSVGRD